MHPTKIDWCDSVWNFVTGCTPVSPGCAHCYAKRMAHRLRGRYGYPDDDPFRVTLHPERLAEPLGKRKPQNIFVCSMADLFHKDVPTEFRDKAVAVMALCRQHTFLCLTKRAERMAEYCLARETYGRVDLAALRQFRVEKDPARLLTLRGPWQPGPNMDRFIQTWPPPNIWLGVSAEDQERLDERAPHLVKLAAAGWHTFLSLEPLLGGLNVTPYLGDIGAGILGAESGPGARPMDPDWARAVRDQCKAAGVPFFLKAMDAKKNRVLDGRTHDELPWARKKRP